MYILASKLMGKRKIAVLVDVRPGTWLKTNRQQEIFKADQYVLASKLIAKEKFLYQINAYLYRCVLYAHKKNPQKY
jgi:hypothetical protein